MRVTVISGFLGSGKTTLLRRLMRQCRHRRIGVIVNDMSELEVDGDLLRNEDFLSEKCGNFISLFSGSISGTQRAAFAQVLEEWRGRIDLDDIIVETSGSSQPWPLIEEIIARPEYTMDGFITLIDAKAFAQDYDHGRALIHAGTPNSTTALMREQVMLADIILLTKVETMSAASVQQIAGNMTGHNPHAGLLGVSYGGVSADKILDIRRFDLRRSKQIATSWRSSEAGDTAPCDLGSTVVRDSRPLHPQRLWTLFRERLGQGILRSKGFLWMPSRDRDVLLWNQAASSIEMELTGVWRAALLSNPDGRLQPEEIDALREMLKDSHLLFGDRVCELTIIGTARDRRIFVGELMACFCTDDEISAWQGGATFEDPWPKTLLRHI